MSSYPNLYPVSHIHPPQDPSTHSHTAILLHGRGSNGPELAEELFSSKTSGPSGQSLPEVFPTWRWVFPTARDRWSSTFREDLAAWFDVVSLTDIESQQDVQVEGLKESLQYVLRVIEDEARILGGRTERIVLGGMSQGMAMGLWALLGCAGKIGRSTGIGMGGEKGFSGFIGFCGWLPFAGRIERTINDFNNAAGSGGVAPTGLSRKGSFAAVGVSAVDAILQTPGDKTEEENVVNMQQRTDSTEGIERGACLESTPVFLCHDGDDAFVDVSLGQQARDVLGMMHMQVEWHEYTGSENDGHWIKEPEGFDDIVSFLKASTTGEPSGH